MKFSDVLMRCWMQERNPDTGLRKIDDDANLNRNQDCNEEEEEEEESDEEKEQNEPTESTEV